MSPEEVFRKGVSRISAGKRIRRGEKSIFKQRRNSRVLKSKIDGKFKCLNKEKVQDKDGGSELEKECHVDVII